MSQPIEVDLPHSLGKDEARRRIANNIHKLQDHIPGGAKVESGWAGDQLNLRLPGMLGMFAGPIQAMLQKKGNLLLEDKHD